MPQSMIMSFVVMIVSDHSAIGLAIDGQDQARFGPVFIKTMSKFFIIGDEARRLAWRIIRVRRRSQFELLGLAIVFGVDRDFRGINRNLFRGRSVENVDRDSPGVFIVQNLCVVFFVSQLDEVAMMWALGWVDMPRVVVMGVHRVWWTTCFGAG